MEALRIASASFTGSTKAERDVGFVALVQRDEFADEFAHVADLRILLGGIHRDLHRPLQQCQRIHAARFQAVQRVLRDVPLHRVARGQLEQRTGSRQHQQQRNDPFEQGQEAFHDACRRSSFRWRIVSHNRVAMNSAK